LRFKPGDRVHVTNLGTGTVREVRNGRCLVEVKGRAVLIDDRQLTPAEAQKGRSRPAERPPAPEGRTARSGSHAPATLDLHGMTTLEAIVALDEFLNESILSGQPELRVIHGRSGGRLKHAVHQRLRALPVVRGFRVDPANPGVTIVTT
jgi:dsDNA-specific endonuclease/ATPase MutS2